MIKRAVGLVVALGGTTSISAPSVADSSQLTPEEQAISDAAQKEDIAEIGQAEYDALQEEMATWPTTITPSSSGTRPAVDWGYKACPSANSGIDELGLTWRHSGFSNRTVLNTVPSNLARYGSVPDSWTDDEISRCRPSSSGTPGYNVRSWQSIYDQFDCHDFAPGGLRTGPTWDLEGHRTATRNRWTWAYNKCSW